MVERVRNWAGNVEFTPSGVARPGSVDELQEVVADAAADGRRVRAIGAAHSFSEIVATDGVSIATGQLDRVVGVDLDAMTVTVEAGIRHADLGPFLYGEGLAIHNLGSLPHLTVSGAIATATHGSGDRNQNLAGAVASIDVVDARGEIARIDRHTDDGAAAVVGLGGFGVVARVTLHVEPTFDIAQDVLVDLPFESGADHLDELLASAYSVSLFTDWRADVFHQVWRKRRGAQMAPSRLRTRRRPRSEPPRPRRRCIPFPACRPPRAPSSSDDRGRGTCVFRTSGPTRYRASAPSCNPSTSSIAWTPPRRCAPCDRCETGWRASSS